MKSSTVRRSTLSRESMEVIEALAKAQENDGTPGEYLRPNDAEITKDNDFSSKAQEIDLLWQNFKTSQLSSNSPAAYILIGFLIGVTVTFITFLCLNTYAVKTHKNILFFQHKSLIEQTLEEQTGDISETNNENVVTVPAEEENIETEQAQNNDNIVQNEQKEHTENTLSKTKKYIVKNGDTGESIIKHFYGSYTPERAEAIIKLNNLKNLDRINIDQELLIPVE